MDYFMRLQNLDESADIIDVRYFFVNFDIPDGGVQIGRGEAFINFTSESDLLKALDLNGHELMGRKVKLLLDKKGDTESMPYIAVPARASQDHRQDLTNSATVETGSEHQGYDRSHYSSYIDLDKERSKQNNSVSNISNSVTTQQGTEEQVHTKPTKPEASDEKSKGKGEISSSTKISKEDKDSKNSTKGDKKSQDFSKHKTTEKRKENDKESTKKSDTEKGHSKEKASQSKEKEKEPNKKSKKETERKDNRKHSRDRSSDRSRQVDKNHKSKHEHSSRSKSKDGKDERRNRSSESSRRNLRDHSSERSSRKDSRDHKRRGSERSRSRSKDRRKQSRYHGPGRSRSISPDRDRSYSKSWESNDTEPGHLIVSKLHCSVTTRDLRDAFCRYNIKEGGIATKDDPHDPDMVIGYIKFSRLEDAVKAEQEPNRFFRPPVERQFVSKNVFENHFIGLIADPYQESQRRRKSLIGLNQPHPDAFPFGPQYWGPHQPPFSHAQPPRGPPFTRFSPPYGGFPPMPPFGPHPPRPPPFARAPVPRPHYFGPNASSPFPPRFPIEHQNVASDPHGIAGFLKEQRHNVSEVPLPSGNIQKQPVARAKPSQPQTDMPSEEDTSNKGDQVLSQSSFVEMRGLSYLRIDSLPVDVTACQVWAHIKRKSAPPVCVDLVQNESGTALFAIASFRFKADTSVWYANHAFKATKCTVVVPEDRHKMLAFVRPLFEIFEATSESGERIVTSQERALLRQKVDQMQN